jgi:isocitrate dehydrogenase kinase/phosphatase
MKKLLDEHYVLVQLDEEHKIIEVIWKKFAMSRQYRQTIELAYQAILEHDLVGWLSDMTNASVVAMEDQHWMKNVMIPKGVAAGISKVAIVDSKDIFSQKFVRSIESNMGSFSSEHFPTIEDAREWLKKATVLN